MIEISINWFHYNRFFKFILIYHQITDYNRLKTIISIMIMKFKLIIIKFFWRKNSFSWNNRIKLFIIRDNHDFFLRNFSLSCGNSKHICALIVMKITQLHRGVLRRAQTFTLFSWWLPLYMLKISASSTLFSRHRLKCNNTKFSRIFGKYPSHQDRATFGD